MNHEISAWDNNPDYKIDIIELDKRATVVVYEEIVADSNKVLIVREQQHNDVYYFPKADVAMSLLHETDKQIFCPYKGQATHWALELALSAIKIDVAAWSYPAPFVQVSQLKDYIGFYPEVIDYE